MLPGAPALLSLRGAAPQRMTKHRCHSHYETLRVDRRRLARAGAHGLSAAGAEIPSRQARRQERGGHRDGGDQPGLRGAVGSRPSAPVTTTGSPPRKRGGAGPAPQRSSSCRTGSAGPRWLLWAIASIAVLTVGFVVLRTMDAGAGAAARGRHWRRSRPQARAAAAAARRSSPGPSRRARCAAQPRDRPGRAPGARRYTDQAPSRRNPDT